MGRAVKLLCSPLTPVPQRRLTEELKVKIVITSGCRKHQCSSYHPLFSKNGSASLQRRNVAFTLVSNI